MTLPLETYERIWRETNDEYRTNGRSKLNRWNEIFNRKVSEELEKRKARR